MPEKKLGEILIGCGLITPEQFATALELQCHKPGRPIGQILCEQGFLTAENLNTTLDYNQKRLKLGEILVKARQIDREKLDKALEVSKKEKIPLGKALLNLHYVEEEQIARAVAQQYDLPLLSLRERNFDSELSRFLNPNYALRHRIAVIDRNATTLTLAMAFPLSAHLLHELEMMTHFKISPVIVRESEVLYALEKIYGPRKHPSTISVEQLALDMVDDLSPEEARSRYVLDYNIDYLFKRLLMIGIKCGASDIHLESTERGMQVRFRVDGVLQFLELDEDTAKISAKGSALISKVKILCELDITERRRPQDGSFRVKIGTDSNPRNIDFRVSVIPTRFGENVVIRILDKIGPMTLETIGFSRAAVDDLERLLGNPTGMFLVTGPTGSGKSSTLYAILARLNKPGVKILTVEDPIEYSIEGISQSEVNEGIGNTFAEFLRSFLRQDPDHIMVGEIRDLDTCSIAIRASLTGHTVLSTLHTNDATSAVPRFIDIGVEPTLISATLRCVIAQRLVRVNCPHCKAVYQPTATSHYLEEFLEYLGTGHELVRGKGCVRCHQTGFMGRKPIIELWAPTREEAVLINRRPDNGMLREAVFGDGRRQTMLQNGLDRVREGETTIEELIRVVPFEQIEEFIRFGKARTAGT